MYDGFPANTGPAAFTPLLYGHFGVAVFIVVSGFSPGLAPAQRGWRLGRGGYWTFMRRRAWRISRRTDRAGRLSGARGGDRHPHRRSRLVEGCGNQLLPGAGRGEGHSPNGAFWSIAVEWQLYWVFPLLLLVRRRGPVVLTALVMAAVVVVGIAGDHGGGVVAEKILHLSPQLGALFVYGLVAAGRRFPALERRPRTLVGRSCPGRGARGAGRLCLAGH